MTTCAHDYEIQYTRKHPGKVAECGFCDAKFQEGQQLKSNLPAGYVKFNQLLKEKPVSIENAKIVKAVATINALTAEEYALVLALTERKVEKVKKERKSRKTRGQPAAPEVAETK